MDLRRNIRLLLEYDGTRYHGWQRQLDAATIQGVLEAAVARLTQAPVAIIGSRRPHAGGPPRGRGAHLPPHYVWWLALPLDLTAMVGAAAFLPGEHDFTAFRASGSDNLNPVRRVLAARWLAAPGGRL